MLYIMKTHPVVIQLIFLFSLVSCSFTAQNETTKWYFGNRAGLDFMTNPPTPITTSSMNTTDACASMADGTGNLLFYTDGVTVWNASNQVMANGTGLLGSSGSSQSPVIIKKPGSAFIYYIFTTGGFNGGNYSTVDMSLAGGSGSVTAKNIFLVASSLSEKVAAVNSCNGTDIWVILRNASWSVNVNNAIDFYAFLVTPAGVSNTPVISPANSQAWSPNNFGVDYGSMKFSPNGKKLGLAAGLTFFGVNNNNQPFSLFELYDFNAATGVISNSLGLAPTTNYYLYSQGCEFSPDGSKFYGTVPAYGVNYNPPLVNTGLMQWDLCAGSNSAIVASQYTVCQINPAINNVGVFGGLQVAPNGKIYMANYSLPWLSVINNPNLAGAACNYSGLSQSTGLNNSNYGLPNFKAGPLPGSQTLTPFTYTLNCVTASFTAPPDPTLLLPCASAGYSLSNVQWIFGDPASGAANTSTLTNPVHAFSAPGTYTASFIHTYTCGSDTVRQVLVIPGPLATVSSSAISCANLGSATVSATGGIGPYAYTWLPSLQTGSVATGLSPGTHSVSITDTGNNCTFTTTATFTPPVPLSGTLSSSAGLACNGVPTGTAQMITSGGSGTAFYYWISASATLTTPLATNLGAGNHTITVIDAITSCSLTQFFYMAEPPPLILAISASKDTACVGEIISLTATASGGTPGAGYAYSWTGGPTASIYNVSEANAGIYNYTVTGSDANTCSVVQNITLSFIAAPVLSVQGATICPLETMTLTANGAASYTWSPGSITGATFTGAPPSTAVYSVSGTALGCTSAPQTVTVSVKSVPAAAISSSVSSCSTQSLFLAGTGGLAYAWQGPLTFTSFLQTPVLSPVSANHSGMYSLTVTAANSCTASASQSITIYPVPVTVAGDTTVCTGQVLQLSAGIGTAYLWSGPQSFSSTLQNVSISTSGINASGNYSVLVTSAQGCTNMAVTEVSVVPGPAPLISAASFSLCEKGLLELNGTGGITYSWTGPQNFSAGGPRMVLENISTAHSGDYTLTVTDQNNCQGSISRSITVHTVPIGYFNAGQLKGCAPFCPEIRLAPAPPASASGIILQIEQQSYAGNTVRHCFNKPGSYSVQGGITDINNCTNVITAEVTVYPKPVADFYFHPDKPVAGLDAVAFTNASTGEQLNSWNWYFIDNEGRTDSAENATYLFEKPGAYPVSLVVSNTWGCADTVVKAVTIHDEFTLYVPNAFTPNGDSQNDFFSAKGSGIVSYSMQIYNRWGELIFQSADLAKGWDGCLGEKDCKSDVYAWRITASGVNGRAKAISGHVTLYR